MTQAIKVAVLIGSPRQGSLSERLAAALAALAPPELELRVVPIKDLPLFNPDLDRKDLPPVPAWKEFRDSVRSSDALLFITPEYNRSVPAILKNALEVGSRPYTRQAFSGKPAAIVTQSTGMLGGFGANHHLRQILVFLNAHVLAQPEIYLSQADKLFDAEGALAEGPGKELLTAFLAQFHAFILRHPAPGA